MKPTFETERLRIRQPRESDRVPLIDMAMDDEVMHFISDGGQPREEAEITASINIDSTDDTFGGWTIEDKRTGELYGWIVLMPLDKTEDIEVGYGLMKSAWGRGIATEAARRVVDYGLNELNLPEVVAITRPDNIASQNVLLKAGLNRAGFRDAYGYEGHFYFKIANPG